ncbi:MAG: hypothetical protein JWQ09_4852 [Segetibacter sp.]|nr:hypothetical protein [Segetibacter sp.]
MKVEHVLRIINYVILFFVSLLLLSQMAYAQKGAYKKQFQVKDNVMYITLPKNLSGSSLDSFITSYNLSDIGLYTLLRSGKTDSLEKSDWKLERSSNSYYTLSKKMTSGTDLKKSADRIVFSSIPTPDNWRVVGGNRVIYGVNKFKNNQVFRHEDDITYFFLKGYSSAKSVKLAGNFTNWQYAAFPLTRTEDGWIVPVRLVPGKYYYKFIIDGKWTTDPANYLSENDGLGNTNSVYFVPNKIISLKGYQNAKSVSVTGSFNNWAKNEILLEKKGEGWQVPLYLEQGTHYYKFIVDGKLINENDEKRSGSDERKLALGKSSVFVLKGFKNARKVALAGNFNDWKPNEIFMEPVEEGWKIAYVLGPGNYQYKFIIDGNWITDPANPNIVSDGKGNLNSFMVVAPNYTFRLKGYTGAKRVHLTGEFNNWSPEGLAMVKAGNEWVCPVYLGRGKHLYKFIVDGKWIRDPSNPLWEDDDNNSVLWIE